MNKNEAKTAINIGVGVALFSGVITAAISVTAILTHHPIWGIDGWSIIDAFIILLLAFGVYKKSRVAAFTLVVYFFLAKVLMISESGAGSLFAGLIFIYFYATAFQGTIVFHQMESMRELKRSWEEELDIASSAEKKNIPGPSNIGTLE